LTEKDIERFANFVDIFKAEYLQKNKVSKLPPEKWILSQLNEVILSRLVEANLLHSIPREEFEKIKKEVESLDNLNKAMQEVENEIRLGSSFEKWKKELSKKCLLDEKEDNGDLVSAYNLWIEIKKNIKNKLFFKTYELEEKSNFLSRTSEIPSGIYYTEAHQRKLIADLVFLPSLCQSKNVQVHAHETLVKNLSESLLVSLEKMNIAEKANQLSASQLENQGFVERNNGYYRFSERSMRELADASFFEATFS
jgi:hypothetical protein